MKRRAVFVMLATAICIIAFSGCSVTGDIGTLKEYFENDVVLTEYYKGDEDTKYKERELDKAELYDIENDYLEYGAYSSIGLSLSSSKSEKEITTVTLQIRAQEACEMNFTFFVDGDMQYESGTRSMTAGGVYSFVITGIEYPATAKRFYFKNVAPSDEPDQAAYAGYEALWKLEYMQIIYNER